MIPAAFFERNEGSFRGSISRNYAPMQVRLCTLMLVAVMCMVLHIENTL
jgi:hypothetical protein